MNKQLNTQAVGKTHGFVFEEKCTSNKIRHSERVYICSPLRSNTDNGMLNNMSAASGYAGYALNKLHYQATAIHSYLPFVLDDRIPEQREQALKIGLQLLNASEILMVCGDRITDGMRGEIEYAARENKQIIVFNEKVFPAVLDIVAKSGADRFKISLERNHPEMANPPKEKDFAGWLKMLKAEV